MLSLLLVFLVVDGNEQWVLTKVNYYRGKGQSLFANTTSKNATANRNGSLDAEVGKVIDGEGKKDRGH